MNMYYCVLLPPRKPNNEERHENEIDTTMILNLSSVSSTTARSLAKVSEK